MAFRTNKMPVLQEKSASGTVATFNTALAMPLASCNIALTATQSGSGTPSPSNPRPITGHSAIHIGDISDNTNISYFQGLLNGTYGFVDLGSLQYFLTQSGLFQTISLVGIIKNASSPSIPANVLAQGYTTIDSQSITGPQSSTPSPNMVMAENTGGVLYFNNTSYTDVPTFKTAMSGVYLIYELATPTTPSFTNAEFEALCEAFGMNGQSFTIQIGSTVYGGEYDAITGVLTVTHGIYTLTGNETWSVVGSGASLRAYVVNIVPNKKPMANGICNYFKYGNGESVGEFDMPSYYLRFNIYGIATTSAEFNTWITNHSPVTVVYELATPQTIQLPPCPIDTIANSVNNIWVDTGDIDLTYKDLDIAKRGNFREVFKLPS